MSFYVATVEDATHNGEYTTEGTPIIIAAIRRLYIVEAGSRQAARDKIDNLYKDKNRIFMIKSCTELNNFDNRSDIFCVDAKAI